ncbi:MAG: hypothetical protein IJW94_01865 [Oscillospiraceae bacterium]|nr:hypothetical protein [Oscillospiraceae bacterium]
MTQETKTALSLYERSKRAGQKVNRTEEDTRALKDGVGDDLRYQLIHADVKEWVNIGEELRVFCKGKLSIKRDLEAEIQKIDAKVKKEAANFDSRNKITLNHMEETIRKAKKKSAPWQVVDDVIRILSKVLAVGWVVFYFFVASKDPNDPTFGFLKQLFYSEIMLLILLLPPALIIFLGSLLAGATEHFTDSASADINWAKEEIEKIKKERAELIASIEKEKEDYLAILELI